jgi:hypothetical protein
MESWRRTVFIALVCLAEGCAYTGAQTAEGARGLTSVHIAVVGDTTGTSALVVDAKGRRSGWGQTGPVRGVPGCGHSYGWDEGIPDADSFGDSSDTTVVADSLGVGSAKRPPRYHSFGIRKLERGRGFIDEGSCDLLVDSGQGGWVSLYVQAGQTEPEQCGTKLREDLGPGIQYRWRVRWWALGDSCKVEIARISPKAAPTSARP